MTMPTMQVVFLVQVTRPLDRAYNETIQGFLVESTSCDGSIEGIKQSLNMLAERACERAKNEINGEEWEWSKILSFQILPAPSST